MDISKKISSHLQKLITSLRKKENWPYIGFFLIIGAVLFVNAFHESYPDEFDNIMGGWYIMHGLPIYTGFFTHHGPVAYFLSTLIELIGGRSFVHYRVIFAVLIFVFLLWSYRYLRDQFGKERSFFYLIFIGIITLAGNYYWLHMLLADTLSAYFLAPVVSILFLRSYYKTLLTKKDLTIISILVSLTALCSLTFLYLAILIYAYTFYLYLRSQKMAFSPRSLVTPLLIFAVPYLIFLIYLVITGSLSEYLYQGWIFNQQYYIYNYPRPAGATGINPLRFAIVIANTFYNSYFALLQQVATLNINFPVNITMAVGTLGLIIYLFVKRKFVLALFLMLLITYANGRSDPLTSKETDYQSAVYIMIAFLSISFLLTRIFKDLVKTDHYGEKVISVVLLILVGFYSIFSLGFLTQKFFNRSYAKYMGQAPLIYDSPELAPIINKLVPPNDPVWVGPFEFKELFYINGKPATHYQIFIPGMGFSPEIRENIIKEFEQSKPKIVYFQKDFFILGRSPQMYGQFFIDYLNDHYDTLKTYRKDDSTYTSSLPVTEKVDLNERLYIRKENAAEMIQKLLDNNFIHESSQ